MINSTTSNVKLTLENLQQEAEIQGRLSVLQSEINNASKVLKGIKLETDRAVKEKAYQEELLANATTQAETKTKELKDLIANHTDTSAKLSSLNSEIKTKTTEHTAKSAELSDRESKVSQKEQQLSEQGNALGREKVLLSSDRAYFDSKVARLKEVISTF